MKPWKAESMLFLVTLVWGGTFVFTKFGLNDATPAIYLVLRFSIALLIGIIIFYRKLFNISKTILYQGLLLGLFFGCGFILQTTGLELTSVTKTAFITGMAVIFTPFVFKIIRRKSKVLFWSKIGVIIALVGLWIFTKPEIDNINLGDLLTLLSTIFWALYIVFMDVFTKGKDSFTETVQLVILQFVGTLCVAFTSHLIMEGFSFQVNFSENLFISLAYNGILASFILTFIHTGFQRYTTPVKAVLIFSLEPVAASIVAVIALNEILSGREYLGASILFTGVLVSELGAYVGSFFKSKYISNKA